jgi:hypothetical protein
LRNWAADYAYLQDFKGDSEDSVIDRLTREQVDEISFPFLRFTPYAMLPYSIQVEVMEAMNYTESSWNNPGDADVESYALEDICFFYEGAPQNWTCPTLQTIVKIGFDRENDDQWGKPMFCES